MCITLYTIKQVLLFVIFVIQFYCFNAIIDNRMMINLNVLA